MAFSLSAIEDIFKEEDISLYLRGSFFQHSNYLIVFDYLTGRSASLAGLVQTPENHFFYI